MTQPKIIIIAGPNGAGKRMFFDVYPPFVYQWVLYDNAGNEPLLMDWSDKP